MKLRLLVGLLGLSGLAWGEPGTDWYQPVTRASLVAETSQADVERIYPLSAPRRISGRLRMEASAEVSGQLQARTWELPAGHDAMDAFVAARAQLLAHGDARLLFWCEGRECGPSSLWVNRVFDAPRLVAPDEQQASLLVQLGDASLVAVYVVTRGNRRAYLHLERLDATAPLPALQAGAETLRHQLRDAGHLELEAPLAATDDPRLAQLTRLLQLDTGMRVRLVSADAHRWRDELVARGVRTRRLDVAPDPAQAGLRLEWLR